MWSDALLLFFLILPAGVLACNNNPSDEEDKPKALKLTTMKLTVQTPKYVVTTMGQKATFPCSYSTNVPIIDGSVDFWWTTRRGYHTSDALYDGQTERINPPSYARNMDIESRYSVQRGSGMDLTALRVQRNDNWDSLCCVVELPKLNVQEESCIDSRVVDFRSDAVWCSVGASTGDVQIRDRDDHKVGGNLKRVEQGYDFVHRQDYHRIVHVSCGFDNVYPAADFIVVIHDVWSDRYYQLVKSRNTTDKSMNALYTTVIDFDIVFPTGDRKAIITAKASAEEWNLERLFQFNIHFNFTVFEHIWCAQHSWEDHIKAVLLSNRNTVTQPQDQWMYYACGISNSYVRSTLKVYSTIQGEVKKLIKIAHPITANLSNVESKIYSNVVTFALYRKASEKTKIEFVALTEENKEFELYFNIHLYQSLKATPSYSGFAEERWGYEARDKADAVVETLLPPAYYHTYVIIKRRVAARSDVRRYRRDTTDEGG